MHMVGRPRQFDEDDVLEKAMQAFWANGYEATSMADLVAATGLLKGSLYQAFGNKHALFVVALRRYLESMRRQETELLESASSPLAGIRAVLHSLIDMADGEDGTPMGCMAVNTLIEVTPHDPQVQKIMEGHMNAVSKTMSAAVAQAQAAGEVSPTNPPEVITALMMTFMAGVATQMSAAMSPQEAHQLLDAQLATLT